jgi:outer membrane immunogenic protein
MGAVRKYLFTAAALIALATSANADGPTYPAYGASIQVGPAWNWTGCYLGGHVGGIWDDSEKWVVRTPGGAFFGQSLGGHDADGWIGGALGGCDYQFARGVLIGFQADYGWGTAKGSHASAREIGVTYHSEVKSLASVTGRVGYAWDRFLGYVKGGGAWADVDHTASTTLLGTAYTSSNTRSGWTVGGGGEYAITEDISVFLEYNYYAFGTADIAFAPRIAGLPTGFLDIEESANVVRVGFNVRLGRFGR